MSKPALQDQLRKPVMFHTNAEQTNAERREAAAALDAQDALLREAERALAGAMIIIDTVPWPTQERREAVIATLAQLKSAREGE